MYFEPLELLVDGNIKRPRNNTRLSHSPTVLHRPQSPQVEKLQDGGFGAANNPSKEMLDELHWQLPKNMGVGTFVSIGTARSPEEPRGSRLQRIIMDSIQRLGDPEQIHQHMERVKKDRNISYHRFNQPNGVVGVKMDDWKPRPTGEDTIKAIKAAFDGFAGDTEIVKDLRQCAKELVDARRSRVEKDMVKWKRFALGRHFYCRMKDCPDDDYRREVDEVKFIAHLKEGHRMRDDEIEDALMHCEGQWTYRGR